MPPNGYGVAIRNKNQEERNRTYPCDSDGPGLGVKNHELHLDEETLVVVLIGPGETADLGDNLVVWVLLLLKLIYVD